MVFNMDTRNEDNLVNLEGFFDALCSEACLQSSDSAPFNGKSTVDVSKITFEEEEVMKRTLGKFQDVKTPECPPVVEIENASSSKENLETPQSKQEIFIRKRRGNNSLTSPEVRETPLPLLPWANSTEVWQTMVYKEEAIARTRNCRLFEDPNSFLPRMRAILLDWIMEVCEVYHLTRITYYLAVDYIDRYLTITQNVPKSQLQLIGISALFIAAKLEEIYPPKLSEFSYVCDGACSNQDILECELILLNALGWDVNPMTPTGWLNLYMQIHIHSKKQPEEKVDNKNFFFPQYSAYQFVQASHLIDLFSLDPGFLLFNYSVIAAGAMYYLFGRPAALTSSGLHWSDLKDCAEYMAVFYKVLRDTHDTKLQCVTANESTDRRCCTYIAHNYNIKSTAIREDHSLQTHTMCLKLFETATLCRLQRMGLSVRKTLVKRNAAKNSNGEKKEGNPKEESFVEVESDVEEIEGDPPIVMFAIEKLTASLATELEDTEEKVFCETEQDHEYFNEKSKYSFDELLVGINECTNKSLLPSKSNKQDDEL